MSGPWESATGGQMDEDLVAQARPGIVLGLCAFALVGTGLTAAIVWPQLWMFGFRAWGFFQTVMPPIISLLGLVLIPVGASVASGRLWAALAAVPVSVLTLLFGGIWTIYCTVNGLFTPLYLVLVGLGSLGTAASMVALALSVRVDRARKALLNG